MVHHIIVKFTDDVSVEQKKEICDNVHSLFLNTKQIKGIYDVSVKVNCVDRPNRYDMMILINMDKEALPAYDECIWHKQWKSDYGKYVAQKVIFDSEE